MSGSYFITAVGTDIGKTFVTCALTHSLLKKGKKVMAVKPVISGWQDDSDAMDTVQILRSMDMDVVQENIDLVSPWRLREPLSPDMAARLEGVGIDYNGVLAFCKQARGDSEYLFVEGVGGVMVPLTKNKLVVDLMVDCAFKVIVVCGSYLGAINHLLTTLSVLESYNIEVCCAVLCESEVGVDVAEMQKSLNNFIDVPIIFLPRVDGGDWAEVENIEVLVDDIV